MNESTFSYGKSNKLIGVLSSVESSSKPIVLMLNAGLIHHMGPNRMWVELARILNKNSINSFRFDLSGIGDSEKYTGNLPQDEEIINSVIETMNFLEEERGYHSFIIIGLCSGADFGHYIALQDERVTGFAFVDAYGFPTFKFKIKDRLPSLINPKAYLRTLKKIFTKPDDSSNNFIDVFGRKWPSQNETIRDINIFIERKMKLFFIYTGGVPIYYNYKKQFFDMFKTINFKNCLTFEFFKNSDHTFTNVSERENLIMSINNWLTMNTFIMS